MIEKFDTFINEAAWLNLPKVKEPFLLFVKEVDKFARKELNLSVIQQDKFSGGFEFALQYGEDRIWGGSSLCKFSDKPEAVDSWKWDFDQGTKEEGWLAFQLNPADNFCPGWFQITYKLVGHELVPDSYSGWDRSKADADLAAIKKHLGQEEYLAQLSLGNGRIPRNKIAEKIAKKYLELLPSFPKMNLWNTRGERLSKDLGIGA